MNRYRQSKNNFYFIIVMLFILGIGIGYAVLSERLTIDNTISYDSMKWDIGFTAASNNGGSVTSLPSISTDKKSITISCDLGTSTKSETCIAKATITNASTFNVMLSEAPTITYNDTYISSVDVTWLKNSLSIVSFDGIASGNSEDIQIKITTKELSEEMLPEESLSISITLTFNWIEADGSEKIVDYVIGQELSIGTEKFNVISTTDTTVTMLAQYNLGTDYRQNPLSAIEYGSYKHVDMKTPGGWGKPSEPTEIDINTYSIEAALYINTYVSFLNDYLGATTISGNLITLKELKKLGCNINDTYKEERMDCLNSPYQNWLINEQNWVTRSADSTNTEDFFAVMSTGYIETSDVGGRGGARPVITISKEILEKLDSIITFTIAGTEYRAYEGMTWGEWVDSEYNTNNYYIVESENSVISTDNSLIADVVSSDIILKNNIYKHLISFKVQTVSDDTVIGEEIYYAYEGMTYGEWAESDFNTGYYEAVGDDVYNGVHQLANYNDIIVDGTIHKRVAFIGQ